jgi:putative hydrolase
MPWALAQGHILSGGRGDAVADHPHSPDPGEPEPPQLPPELAALLSSLTGGQGVDPDLAKALHGMGLDRADPAMLSMMAAQLRSMLGGGSQDPFDVSLASQTALGAVTAAGGPSPGPSSQREVDEAARVAGLWLDQVTSFDAPAVTTHAWSRGEWVRATMPTWKTLVEPVAEGVSRAIGDAMRAQIGQLGEGAFPEGMVPEGLLPAGMDPAALLGQMEPLVARMSGSMFAVQLGQAVGTLAGEVLSGTEVGLPLVPDQAVVLLPASVEEFARGLDIDLAQVRIFLAVREAARVRLFADVAWLGPQLLAAVRDYARDITIDTERIETSLQQVDPTDAQALQAALQDQLFRPDPSPAQQAALRRLETYLALVEGWVDVVTERATREHLPQAAALGEAVRRRRATGGPAEKVFSGLVGLELRPRRLRDAANLWAALEDRHAATGRDAAWGHPDVAPTAADLDDPLGYVERAGARGGSADEVDAALETLLRGGTGGPPEDSGGGTGGPPEDSGGDTGAPDGGR